MEFDQKNMKNMNMPFLHLFASFVMWFENNFENRLTNNIWSNLGSANYKSPTLLKFKYLIYTMIFLLITFNFDG
jgi:hypothetical protein